MLWIISINCKNLNLKNISYSSMISLPLEVSIQQIKEPQMSKCVTLPAINQLGSI